MTKKKKQSTGLIIAVVMLGILDMAALAVLLAGVLVSPAKGETVKAELPADFRENDQEYYDMDMTADYPSAATVSYGGNAIFRIQKMRRTQKRMLRIIPSTQTKIHMRDSSSRTVIPLLFQRLK